jgi:hypothetical protein
MIVKLIKMDEGEDGKEKRGNREEDKGEMARL